MVNLQTFDKKAQERILVCCARFCVVEGENGAPRGI